MRSGQYTDLDVIEIKEAKKAVAKELLSAEAKVNQERAEAISKRKAEEALAAQEAAAAAAAEAAAQEATEGEVKTEE